MRNQQGPLSIRPRDARLREKPATTWMTGEQLTEAVRCPP